MKCVRCVVSSICLVIVVGAVLHKLTTDARSEMMIDDLTVSESMTPAEQAYRLCLSRELGEKNVISVNDTHVCAEESDYIEE